MAKYDILSSEKHNEFEIHQNEAQKQFQAMDHLETSVDDAQTPPDVEVTHRMV